VLVLTSDGDDRPLRDASTLLSVVAQTHSTAGQQQFNQLLITQSVYLNVW